MGRCLICSFLLLTTAVFPPVSMASSQQRMQEAIQLLEAKNYPSAIEVLTSLEESILNPDQLSSLFAVAYLGRGYQLLSSSNYPESRQAFLEGRRYDANNPLFFKGEAMAWLQQGQYAEAISLLEQALGLSRQDFEIYYLLGRASYAEGRMAEALEALTRARELSGEPEVEALLEKVRREWRIEQTMAQDVLGHFSLSFVDGKQAAALPAVVLETLEDAYSELGSELNYYPEVKVPVLLYSGEDFALVTNSPDWAGAVYDGKIRLPGQALQQMSAPLEALLYHEYSHVLVHFLSHRHAPVWLNEGLAEVAGRSRNPLPLVHLQAAVQKGQLLNWDQLADSFRKLPADQVPLAYEQSYSLVDFMVDRFGWHKMAELLQRLGRREDWRESIAFVYRGYGLDWPAIQLEWRAEQGF